MIKDKNIAWKTKRIDRDFRSMYGNLNGTFQGAGGAVNAAHSVGASEQTIVQAGADGDEFYDMFTIPWDMDVDEPLRWRVLFSHATTDVDTPTFTFGYMGRAAGEAIADVTSHKDTTFSGAVAATADAIEVTDWTSTSSETYVDADDVLLLTKLVTTYLGGAGANEIELISLQLEYTIKSTATDGIRHTTENESV